MWHLLVYCMHWTSDGQESNGLACKVEICQEKHDEFIPDCGETIKSYLGQQFETVDESIQFYKRYASVMDFDVRCSTMRKNQDGNAGVKYLLCSREGNTMNINEGNKITNEDTTPNIKTRRWVSNRVGCKARCGLKRQKDCYYAVNVLQEIHNHHLCSLLARPFLKITRKLDIYHQAFIATYAKAIIGPSKALELYEELVGGFNNIGVACAEFRNYRRDIHAHL